jgi:hypothetical protein
VCVCSLKGQLARAIEFCRRKREEQTCIAIEGSGAKKKGPFDAERRADLYSYRRGPLCSAFYKLLVLIVEQYSSCGYGSSSSLAWPFGPLPHTLVAQGRMH